MLTLIHHPGRVPIRRGLAAIGLFAAILASTCLARAEQTATQSTYLALGDSRAFGLQIAKLKGQIAAGAVRPESFDTGYIDVLAAHLKARKPDLEVVDLRCPGESTASFVNGPCGFATTGKPFGTQALPLHSAYPGAQLTAATDDLAGHPGAVGLITLDIGINDLRAVLLGCPEGEGFKACVAAALPAALDRTGANLRTILARLRAAAPGVPILVGTCDNWLAASDPDTDRFVEVLNRTIASTAAEEGARVIDVVPAFNRTGDARAQLCELTLCCRPARDLHPSDAGYRGIGDLFAAAAEVPPGATGGSGAATRP